MAMATSSAIRLADLALTWSLVDGAADLSMIDSDLASDDGMLTAILLSLFTDRRADVDDVPPSGDPNDRRGWWGDAFAAVEGDLIGSRLWLLERSKRTNDVQRRAAEYAREALAWMVDDQVAATVDIDTDATDRDLLIGLTLHRPGRDAVSFRFARAWDSLVT